MAAVAVHLFTTRHWLLGRRAATDVDPEAAWADVAQAMSIAPAELARVHQVHGSAVVNAHSGHAEAAILPNADIIVAHAPMGCAIQTADCVPLLLADPHSGAVAAAHAGWRGLVQRVPEVAVAALASSAGARPGELIAAIGPAIGPCCYEVGDDVREAFGGAAFGADGDRWFSRHLSVTARNRPLPHLPPAARRGRCYFDTWRATRDQLQAAGMRPERIYSSDLCTASHDAVLCSYRRDGVGAGRMAAAIRGR